MPSGPRGRAARKAAQFMPFASLRGYERLVDERLEEQRLRADGHEQLGGQKLRELAEALGRARRGERLLVTYREGPTRRQAAGPLGGFDARGGWVEVGGVRVALADVVSVERERREWS